MASAESKQLPSLLRSLNHVSRVVSDVQQTTQFYQDLLGFIPIRRPGGLTFDGAWLYSRQAGVGLHLIKGTPISRPSSIDPKADHLSFVCTSLDEVEELLARRGVPYVRQSIIEEDGVRVSQVFFHDPDNNMIEICNCDELPVELLGDLGCTNCQAKVAQAQEESGWQGVPLGSAAKSAAAADGSNDDSMSDRSSDSVTAQERADSTTLFVGGDSGLGVSTELCCMVEPVA